MMEVLDWFSKKKNDNSSFYSSIDFDKDNKVRSVFWSDARARLYYDIGGGDCTSFDTTFLTNWYDLHFAPFAWRTYMFA
jgi:zinc finger SWIM domain-containing protein 3